jgi:hypothetical protein
VLLNSGLRDNGDGPHSVRLNRDAATAQALVPG